MTTQPNEIVNILVKAQTKLLENFLQTSLQMQKAVSEENAVEGLVKIYEDWYEAQMNVMEELVGELKTHANIDVSYLNSHFDSLKKMQGEYGKKWAETMAEASKSYFGKDFFGMENGNIDSMNQQWNKFYSSWFEPFSKPFKEFSSSGFGAYNVMLETAKDYMKAFYPTGVSKKK